MFLGGEKHEVNNGQFLRGVWHRMKAFWAKKKKDIIKIAKLLLTIAAFVYLIKIAQPEKVITYLVRIDTSLLLIIILLKFISDLFKIWKWMLFARVQVADFSFLTALRSFYMGMTLAVITPFAIGELGRGALASETNKAELSGLVLIDKIFDLATVTLFALSGLAVLIRRAYLIVIIVICYFLGLYLMKRLFALWSKKGFSERNNSRFFAKLISSFRTVPNTLIWKQAWLSIIYFMLFYFQAYLIMMAYRDDFPLEVVLYFPLITLSTILPITIGGLGIREGTAILLLKQYQIPEAIAFNTFFMHFVIANVLAGLLGAILFLFPRKGLE